MNKAAAGGRSAGMAQYEAYRQFLGQEQDIDPSPAAGFYFGTRSAISRGVASIKFSISNVCKT